MAQLYDMARSNDSQNILLLQYSVVKFYSVLGTRPSDNELQIKYFHKIEKYISHICPVSVQIKPGVPRDIELDDLADKIEPCWFQLGIRLDIEVDKLKQIQETEKNKPFEMLYHWKTTKTSRATYQVLHDALCHPRVSRHDLAEMFCCQKP